MALPTIMASRQPMVAKTNTTTAAVAKSNLAINLSDLAAAVKP